MERSVEHDLGKADLSFSRDTFITQGLGIGTRAESKNKAGIQAIFAFKYRLYNFHIHAGLTTK